MKTCFMCREEKPLDNFDRPGPARHNEIYPYCKKCRSSRRQKENLELKITAFSHYGGTICICCGISEPVFLALDHVNNDGSVLRKVHHSGTKFYRWLKRNEWPDLGLQVSCHNCNMGRHINGVCPHQLRNSVTGNMLGSEPRD